MVWDGSRQASWHGTIHKPASTIITQLHMEAEWSMFTFSQRLHGNCRQGNLGVEVNLILLAKPHVSNQSTEKVESDNNIVCVGGGGGWGMIGRGNGTCCFAYREPVLGGVE